MLSLLAVLAAAANCMTRGVIDLRQRQYIWGILGIASTVIILLVPTIPFNSIELVLRAL